MQPASTMPGMPTGMSGQPPFMQNQYPGMSGSFNPNMVPQMGSYPGQTPAQHPASVPLQMSATPSGADNSVVAHKLPSSQVLTVIASLLSWAVYFSIRMKYATFVASLVIIHTEG